MGLARLWLVLLTLLAALGAALAMLAPWTTADDLAREIDARLQRTYSAASLLLRVNARKWVDTSARVASDAVLGESLDQATRGPADLALVHKTVQDRLRYFNEQMKVDLVAATDAHGRVIARVGVDAQVYKDSIEGYPLVIDALRGLRGDDTWSVGGHLYRVAASPVILRDRYVGVVVIGQEATAELAESMKAVLGTDVVLLLHGRILGATGQLPILDQLPAAASAAAGELAKHGQSPPIAIGPFGVLFGAFAGEAGEQQALYALCTPRRVSSSLPGLVVGLLRRDPATLPWRALAPVGGGLLLALLLGLLVLSSAWSPIEKLARQAQSLARGELARLSDAGLRGAPATLARSVNTTLERIAGRVRAETRTQGFDDLSRTMPRPKPTAPAPAPARVAPEPSEPSLLRDPETSPAVLSQMTRGKARDTLPEPHREPRDTIQSSQTPLSSSSDTDPVDTSPAPIFDVTGPEPIGDPLPPPPSLARATTPEVPPRIDRPTTPEVPPRIDRPTTPEVPPRIDRPTTPEVPPRRGFDDQPTSVQSPSEALLVASSLDTPPEVEADFRRVFDEFVETRRTCGEALDGVTFEKFQTKLRQNRTQLIQRYGCNDVRFQVYVKDGKAALKATPIS